MSEDTPIYAPPIYVREVPTSVVSMFEGACDLHDRPCTLLDFSINEVARFALKHAEMVHGNAALFDTAPHLITKGLGQ